MKLYAASFSTILWRFYLMMGIGIASVVSGLYILSILCLPLLLMCLLGISFKSQPAMEVATSRHLTHHTPVVQEAA